MASIDKTKNSTGKPCWIVRYDVYENGIRKQRKRSFKTAKEANAFRSKIENDINHGLYTDSRGFTVGEYLRHWFDTYSTNLRNNSKKEYKNNIERHLIPRIGNIFLDKLTTAAIQKAYNDLLQTEYQPPKYEIKNGLRVIVRPGRTYSAKTVRNAHAVLFSALEAAKDENLILRNPAEKVRLPAKTQIEYVIPEPEQLQQILDNLRSTECYLPALTCALLACRRGEALGLYWSDIDFEGRTITFKRAWIENNITGRAEIGDLKTTNSQRTVPLPDMLYDALKQLREEKAEAARIAGAHVIDSPFVFAHIQGKPIQPNSLTQAFHRAATKAGLPGMRLHDLRHTGITYMLMDGVDAKTVSSFVGHATAGFTLNQYAHAMEQSKIKAASLLEKRIREG